MWKCLCDCGKEHIVRGSNLTTGRTKSCGCLTHRGHPRHGASDTRLYRIWHGIIRRTEDASRKDYAACGGAGIRMYALWRQDFPAFKAWADANGYDDTKHIERRTAAGDYCPDNCFWTDRPPQHASRRDSAAICIDGIERTVAEWSRISGIPARQIRRRIQNGWEQRRAVFAPLDAHHQRFRASEAAAKL